MLARLCSSCLVIAIYGCTVADKADLALPPYEIEVIRAVNTNNNLHLDISLTPNLNFNGPAFLKTTGLNTNGEAVTSNKIAIKPNLTEEATAAIYTVTLPSEQLRTYRVELEWGKEPQPLPITIISENRSCGDAPESCIITAVLSVGLNNLDLVSTQKDILLSVTMGEADQAESVTVPIITTNESKFCELEIEQSITQPSAKLLLPRVFAVN